MWFIYGRFNYLAQIRAGPWIPGYNISFRLEVEDIYIQKLKNWDSKWKKNLETKADEFTKKSVSGKLLLV